MSSWQFNTLYGGPENTPEAVAAHTAGPLTDAHNYACNDVGSEGGPVRKPSTSEGFCVGSMLSEPVTGIFGDIDITDNVLYWPNFVTVQGPTINDVRPLPDWVSVKASFPAYVYRSYEGDPVSGADVCRVPVAPNPLLYRCGPVVLKRPHVEFDLDITFRTYQGYSNRYAEDGTYGGDGPIVEEDADVVETDDDPTGSTTFGDTAAFAADIVPPDPYLNAWVPDPSEPFDQNANKLWQASDILGATYTLTMPGGSYGGVAWSGPSLNIDVTLYWELSGDEAGSGLLMLVV